LARLRRERGITQVEMAEMLGLLRGEIFRLGGRDCRQQ